jgi:hypothetical protein
MALMLTLVKPTNVLVLCVQNGGGGDTTPTGVSDDSGVTAPWQELAADSSLPVWWTVSTAALAGATVTVAYGNPTTYTAADLLRHIDDIFLSLNPAQK